MKICLFSQLPTQEVTGDLRTVVPSSQQWNWRLWSLWGPQS